MDCRQAIELMQDRLDGLSGTDSTLMLEEHLAGCARCQSEWHRLQMLDRLFASAQMVPAPPYLRVQVMARLEQRDRTKRMALACAALALGAVTLALLVFVPAFFTCLSTAGATTALLSGGPATLGQLLNLAKTLGRITPLVVGALASPVAAISLCSVLVALGMSRLLSGLLQLSKPNNAA
ncbi:MAG: zf-HC2 domain-containing protein [Anaerolineae bacterium]|nr:zf-HC2 domain-containing protein [Anaerolineae bacterium]